MLDRGNISVSSAPVLILQWDSSVLPGKQSYNIMHNVKYVNAIIGLPRQQVSARAS